MVTQTRGWWDAAAGRSRCLCTSAVDLARITDLRAQVLDCVAAYQTNAAIAAEVGVALKTVQRTVEDLRVLIGCRSKGELAYWWADHRDRWPALIAPIMQAS